MNILTGLCLLLIVIDLVVSYEERARARHP